MSERVRTYNARRKGKKAYRDGLSISANPMRNLDSRMFWEMGFLEEQERHLQSNEIVETIMRRKENP